MFISRFRIRNYKCFWEPAPIDLGPGFNIITGQNSSGKTALLEALSLSFQLNPHRSVRTAPSSDSRPRPDAAADVSFTVSRDELLELLAVRGTTWAIPYPAAQCDMARGLEPLSLGDSPRRFVERVLSAGSFTFDLRFEQTPQSATFRCLMFPTFGSYPPAQDTGNIQFIQFRVGADGSVSPAGSMTSNRDAEAGRNLGNVFQSHIYRFDAQRFNVGTCQSGNNPVLSPQATNLPEVLSCLQANPSAFGHFNGLVNQILPNVHGISVQPAAGQQSEILVWTIDPGSRRIDLARPLHQSGTGIGQVLAILYVAVNARRPQVLLIDEPQSFLHPGAIRKLMEVLRDNSRHQYIVTTHSPAVISGCDPSTITVARLGPEESSLVQTEPGNAKSLQLCLSAVGARLADVFGADSILWAEGATEEICFPMILRKVAGRPLMGRAVLGIRRVGDLERRDAERAFELLERLSSGPSLLPPTVGIVLDRECRTQDEMDDFSRRRGQPVHFLPRRMYENYLLDPEAVAGVLNRLDNSRPAPVQAEEISRRMEELSREARYFCQQASEEQREHWREHAHAARLLSDLFHKFSEGRVAYDKVRDSVALTEWLIENRPESLRELADFLRALL